MKQPSFDTSMSCADAMLGHMIRSHEYVAIYFRGEGCKHDDDDDDGSEAAKDDNEADDDNDPKDDKVDCDKVLAELETIDDELDGIGIIFVTTEDTEVAEAHGEANN